MRIAIVACGIYQPLYVNRKSTQATHDASTDATDIPRWLYRPKPLTRRQCRTDGVIVATFTTLHSALCGEVRRNDDRQRPTLSKTVFCCLTNQLMQSKLLASTSG